MPSPPPFPIRIEDLTADFLSDALGVTVRSFTHNRIGAARGMLGEIILLTPEYAVADAGPSTLVAKFAALREGALTSARRGRSHERELRCYTEFLSETPARTPALHGAWLDPDTAHFLLLQEAIDVDHTVDQVAGLSVEQARRVLDEAAKLHAHWWQHPRLTEAAWLPPPNGASRVDNLTKLARAGWPLLVDMLGGELSADDRIIGEAHAAGLAARLDAIAVQQRTLVHCDMRADNLLFDPATGHVTLVDWQGAGTGPPAFDIAYFFAQSLTVDTRRAHEDDLLAYYGEALANAGLSLGAEQLRAGYVETFFYSFTIACALPIISDPDEPRVRDLARVVARRSLEAIKDHTERTDWT